MFKFSHYKLYTKIWFFIFLFIGILPVWTLASTDCNNVLKAKKVMRIHKKTVSLQFSQDEPNNWLINKIVNRGKNSIEVYHKVAYVAENILNELGAFSELMWDEAGLSELIEIIIEAMEFPTENKSVKNTLLSAVKKAQPQSLEQLLEVTAPIFANLKEAEEFKAIEKAQLEMAFFHPHFTPEQYSILRERIEEDIFSKDAYVELIRPLTLSNSLVDHLSHLAEMTLTTLGEKFSLPDNIDIVIHPQGVPGLDPENPFAFGLEGVSLFSMYPEIRWFTHPVEFQEGYLGLLNPFIRTDLNNDALFVASVAALAFQEHLRRDVSEINAYANLSIHNNTDFEILQHPEYIKYKRTPIEERSLKEVKNPTVRNYLHQEQALQKQNIDFEKIYLPLLEPLIMTFSDIVAMAMLGSPDVISSVVTNKQWSRNYGKKVDASLWAFTEGDLLLVPFGSYVWHHLLAKKSLKERQSLIPIIYSVLIEEVHAIFSRSTNDSQAYLPSRFSQRLIDKLKQSLE